MPAHKKKITIQLPSISPVIMGEGFAIQLFDQYGQIVLAFVPPQNRRNHSRYRIGVSYTGTKDEADRVVAEWSGQTRRDERTASLRRVQSPDVTTRVDIIMAPFARARHSAFAELRDKIAVVICAALDMYAIPALPAGRRDEYAAMPLEVQRELLCFRFPVLSYPEFLSVRSQDEMADILAASVVVPFCAIDKRWLDMNDMTVQDRRVLTELFRDLHQQSICDTHTPEEILQAIKGLASACPEMVSDQPHVIDDPEAVDDGPSHVTVYKSHHFTRRTICDRLVSHTVLRFTKFPPKAMPFYPPACE